ncbi:unnamed protein product [Linum tenue]|uniref:Uncharacterized protein n=1 Tax=Linum tenue TaxID=586396 RepID=A0AAV0S2L9_9ROSI|nr:unnamed protein product [Linum tenue]
MHIENKLAKNRRTDPLLSQHRTTNKYGVYKLEIPNVEAIDCVDDGSSIKSMCQASLIKSPASTCTAFLVSEPQETKSQGNLGSRISASRTSVP